MKSVIFLAHRKQSAVAGNEKTDGLWDRGARGEHERTFQQEGIPMAAIKIVRKETPSIKLKRTNLRNGEYLLYRLKVWGNRGVFSLVDNEKKVLMKDTDFPDPQQEFVCIWPKKKNEIEEEKDLLHTLSLSFATASKYTFSVQHHKTDGSQVEVLEDIDFESNDTKDEDSTAFRVVVA